MHACPRVLNQQLWCVYRRPGHPQNRHFATLVQSLTSERREAHSPNLARHRRQSGRTSHQVLTSPHTGNPSFAVFVLTYFFFSWLETDLATYLLMQKSAFLGHRTYLLTCRRGVAGGARVLTYCSPELVFAYLQLVATSNIAFEYMAGLIPDWHCH